MRILGLSSFAHDTSAALLEDGVLRAAIEESKMTRSKKTRGLPETAIKFCFQKADTDWQGLDYVAIASRPVQAWMRRSAAGAKVSPLSPMSTGFSQFNEMARLSRELGQFRLLRHQNHAPTAKLVNFEHQLCHAAGAFFLSPFERALIVIMDEDGDGKSGMLAIGEGNQIRLLRSISYPHSLAWLYSQVTELLGFAAHNEEHKTQWLSLGGQPQYEPVFRDMLHRSQPGSLRLDSSYLAHGVGGRFVLSSKFYKRIGLPGKKGELGDDTKRSLAATMQQVCTEAVSNVVEALRKEHKLDQVCFAGGLFQNSLLVCSLEQRLGLDNVFVPPAPGNAGCSVGAALLLHHHVQKHPRKDQGFTAYSGPSFSRHEIKDILDNCKARFTFQSTNDRRAETAVQFLQAGKIVGWFQGAAEFGPRALGNRSVLASPWAPYVKENLNDFIKHREWFRPFAISIPEEDAATYFEASQVCRAMNTLARLKPAVEVLPEGFVLPGNLVRLHTVDRQSNPAFWGLLKQFGKSAPAPMLLNTSFNLFGEPLVVSPLDAIRSYSCSGVDALLMDNFLLSKAPIPASAPVREHPTANVSV
jgi:carbamoyltransferase